MKVEVKRKRFAVKLVIVAVASFMIAIGVLWVINYSGSNFIEDDIVDPPTKPVVRETLTVVDGCQPHQITSRAYLMSIPAIGIENTCIENVGSSKKEVGQLDDPEDIWRFGWFKRSASPGVDGQGVYTCHSGYREYQALCDELPNLAEGAEIIVENSAGKKFSYEVVETRTTAREAVDMAEFQSVPSGYTQGISLMTCVGEWDSYYDTMQDRLTVRAVLK